MEKDFGVVPNKHVGRPGYFLGITLFFVYSNTEKQYAATEANDPDLCPHCFQTRFLSKIKIVFIAMGNHLFGVECFT